MTIIGILTVPLSRNTQLRANYKNYFESYIPDSYVKWLEQSGARVVPICFNWSPKKIDHVLHEVNGVLFPGGDVDRDTKADYRKYVYAYKQIFSHAVSENIKNKHFPLWGTCLGFEFLCMMPFNADFIVNNYRVGKKSLILDIVKARHQNVKFKLYKNSKLPLKGKNSHKLMGEAKIYMNHGYGILTTKENVELLTKYLHIISINKDKANKTYISTIKYKGYPFWGTQWHPEKNAYEFNDKHVEHKIENIKFSRRWSDFFVNECSKNTNKLNNSKLLIYNYTLHNPSDVKHINKENKLLPKHKSAFVQSYYF